MLVRLILTIRISTILDHVPEEHERSSTGCDKRISESRVVILLPVGIDGAEQGRETGMRR